MAAQGEAISNPPLQQTRQRRWSRVSVLLLWLIPLAILATRWLLKPVWAWTTIMVLLATFTVLVGYQVVDLGRGAFVDTRNKISLSRFQTSHCPTGGTHSPADQSGSRNYILPFSVALM